MAKLLPCIECGRQIPMAWVKDEVTSVICPECSERLLPGNNPTCAYLVAMTANEYHLWRAISVLLNPTHAWVVPMTADEYRLWKAAPGLLAACEAVLDLAVIPHNGPDGIQALLRCILAGARAAIAKAKPPETSCAM